MLISMWLCHSYVVEVIGISTTGIASRLFVQYERVYV